MLFSSWAFIFLFLPVFLLAWKYGDCLFQGLKRQTLLLVFSLVFYSFWGLPWLVLLLLLGSANYCLALLMNSDSGDPPVRRKVLFWSGIGINLLPLIWFKYSLFIVQNLGLLLGADWTFYPPGLPLGISFYTFIQIAWLTGIYKKDFVPASLQTHLLFSSCFPYVISGPIVRFPQVGWQLIRESPLTPAGLSRGLSLFVAGLAKKVLLADSLAPCADAVFSAAQAGWPLSTLEAWAGSLCYTFQLYFDFSGYTDMALGIGLMIGLKLPENFNSPYKSTGIVEFWRRWHITLGSWLRDFLYIPLGGNRRGKARQYCNLFLTMLIGGIWHGAGWTFMLWGALHGCMLAANHFFRALLRKRASLYNFCQRLPARLCLVGLTFLCLNLCWVIFRAPSLDGAVAVFSAMFSPSPTPLNPPLTDPTAFQSLERWFVELAPHGYLSFATLIPLLLCMLICWTLPNSRQIFHGQEKSRYHWRPSSAWAIWLASLFAASIACLSGERTFLYFQF